MTYRLWSQKAALLALVVMVALSSVAPAQEQEPIQTPEPGVPEIFTIKGQFVRIAYNNEGYVSLGYRVANQSVGEEWMLLEMGATLFKGVKSYKLKREDLSIDTPDYRTISLATVKEYRQVNLRGLENRARAVRDSINYFPAGATQACRIGFFAEVGGRGPGMAYDVTELSDRRACLGRLYFKVPGGIQYGQHWLNVQFENSLVRVPFRILTKEEEERFRDTWQDIKKEHEKRFKKQNQSE
jgi:hypothetical protein